MAAPNNTTALHLWCPFGWPDGIRAANTHNTRTQAAALPALSMSLTRR